MGFDLNDSDILTKISDADFVALEIKYHFECLRAYHNRHRSFIRSNEENTDIMYTQSKAIGYIELYAYIEDEISRGNYTFYKKELSPP